VPETPAGYVAAVFSVPKVVAEADGWSVFIPGVPVAVDGKTLDDAVAEMTAALREYAADWRDHLRGAPNHRENRWLVRLIEVGDDERIREWLIGERT